MDAQILTSLVDQAVGSVIAILLVTRIEKRLEELITQLNLMRQKIDDLTNPRP